MNKDKLIEQMLKEKGDVNNTIDLDAYARGLIDMFDYIEKQEQTPHSVNSCYCVIDEDEKYSSTL